MKSHITGVLHYIGATSRGKSSIYSLIPALYPCLPFIRHTLRSLQRMRVGQKVGE